MNERFKGLSKTVHSKGLTSGGYLFYYRASNDREIAVVLVAL